jgi:acetolactate synthase-1/2/3 large subunit
VKVDMPIVGDVKDVLTELIAMIRESGSQARWAPGRLVEPSRLAQRDCLKYDRGNTEVIKPQYVVETLWNMTKDATPTSPPTWASTRCGRRSTTASTSRAAGSTPAAWAPWAWACPTPWASSWPSPTRVFCITGEGSIQMNIQELSTCLQYNTPIKIVALNNRYLGMVRQWQEIEYSGRYSHSYMDALPDFVKLAEAYGHVGMLIERPDVEPALREARKLKDRTVFLDFRTDPTENVFPMVQAGKGITEMLLGSEDL